MVSVINNTNPSFQEEVPSCQVVDHQQAFLGDQAAEVSSEEELTVGLHGHQEP